MSLEIAMQIMHSYDRGSFCPYCGDTVIFRIESEIQGDGYMKGWVDSLSEVFQECRCMLSEKELTRLLDESVELEDSPILEDE